jgi:hypothetical protein
VSLKQHRDQDDGAGEGERELHFSVIQTISPLATKTITTIRMKKAAQP